MVIWPKERSRWILKDTAEQTQPWHPTAYAVMRPVESAGQALLATKK